jgi:putative heme-binding domain-containing protein
MRRKLLFTSLLIGALAVPALVRAAGGSPEDAVSLFKPDAAGMAPVNLALHKPATASSSQGGHDPGHAFDDDTDTRWCAQDGTVPQWLAVDLGKPEALVGCRITWEQGSGYQYKVEGSADAKAWTTLADNSGPDAYKNQDKVREHRFGPTPVSSVRYVRLEVTGSESGSWASVFEFEVFGTELAKAATGAAVATDDKRVLAGLKPPAGMDMTLFAAPPDVSYPTCIAAAPSGPVFVGVDQDGSLGKDPDKGWVVRCIDSTGSGKADKFNIFARMDHPRGMVWDDGKLYVLHPPYLTVYTDETGAGVATKSQDLVTGISTETSVKARGADHTTNGIRLGIDGWIYIATGDFGCKHAVGKDGTELTFHGGGILRVRPDGSGLEVYSWGHRNIYDVSVDPLGNVFTRDNTNDGDAWNDRLAYIVPTGYYGYPSRFVHFPGEFIDCLNDYGGGAPCGSIFTDEPSLPPDWGHAFLTVEWGNSAIYHHPLIPQGAGYKAPVEQIKLMSLPRGTDIDVDGVGHVYATSWSGGGFSYSGPHVGYVIRLAVPGAKPAAFPDLRKATDEELVGFVGSPSGVCRLAAQREALRRGDKPEIAAGLEKLALSDQPMTARATAMFTLKLLRGPKADAALESFAAHDDLRELALRALCDRKNDVGVPAEPFIKGLTDANPRTRLVAAWGLGRLGKADAANAILPLVADPDFLVSHVAINSLTTLHATDVCFKAIDPSTPTLVTGALRVLQSIHEVPVVDGLNEKLSKIQEPTIHGEVLGALCRLYYREADWDGSWWGTRPDTKGPYYKNAEWDGTARIRPVLQAALANEKPQVMHSLLGNLERHQIDVPGANEAIAKAAASDPESANLLLETFANRRDLSAEQSQTLDMLAASDKQPAAIRVKAIRLLATNPTGKESAFAVLTSFVAAEKDAKVDPALTSVVEEYIRDTSHAKEIAFFAKQAQTDSPAGRELADSVLLNLAGSRIVKPEPKAEAAKEIAKGWEKPASSVPLLRAIARTRAQGYNDKIQALSSDANAEVAQAAAVASERVGLKRNGPAPQGGDLIEALGYDKTVALVLKEKGDADLGKELFTRQGCVACHTISSDQPPKGPLLAGIAARNTKAELCESIMRPSAKIAQGFETQWFKTKDGDVIEGFVVREGGDEIEVRNITGISTTLKKPDIQKRGKRDVSVMPEGLVVKLTPHDLASIIAYLETLKAQ